MAKTDDTQALLAFIGLYETQSRDGYIGSILVTDQQGVPQEFRCTHPVKPNAIQKPLYGSALEPYIGVHLCGIPLLRSLQNTPALVIVDKGALLGIRKSSDCPVVSLSGNGKKETSKSGSNNGHEKNMEQLTSPNGRYPEISVSVHSNYSKDMEEARGLLYRTYGLMDLIEPFERMGNAIAVLGKQDKTFS